jgi:cytochrome b subunit of formate dehydrogenase
VHLHDLCLLKQNKYGTWMKLLFGPNSMIPNATDGRQAVATIRWFVGMGSRPEYGRWTYWEKFDYFAVFWGIFIIGSTGLTLWFPVFFTRFLPGAFLNVATIVHSDEALLAVGFIFTIHFFNTHLRPEKFPMDTTVFTGHMKMAELKRDKQLEYRTLIATGRLEENLAEPQPAIVVKVIRFFAWMALIIGTVLIVSIVYAMIFVYR